MNIFYLSKDVNKCVKHYHDQHVVKMLLESTQLLSNAIQYHGGHSKYAATHMNHPCSVWARESKTHCIWLYNLICELNNEYRFRYSKSTNHKSFDIAVKLMSQIDLLPDSVFVDPPQCMPDKYKSNNAVYAYRQYYAFEKINNKKWSKREHYHINILQNWR